MKLYAVVILSNKKFTEAGRMIYEAKASGSFVLAASEEEALGLGYKQGKEQFGVDPDTTWKVEVGAASDALVIAAYEALPKLKKAEAPVLLSTPPNGINWEGGDKLNIPPDGECKFWCGRCGFNKADHKKGKAIRFLGKCEGFQPWKK